MLSDGICVVWSDIDLNLTPCPRGGPEVDPESNPGAHLPEGATGSAVDLDRIQQRMPNMGHTQGQIQVQSQTLEEHPAWTHRQRGSVQGCSEHLGHTQKWTQARAWVHTGADAVGHPEVVLH